MTHWKTGTAAILGTLVLGSLIATTASAKPGNGQGNRPSTSGTEATSTTSAPSQTQQGNGRGNGRGNRPTTTSTTPSTPTTTTAPSTPTTTTTPATPTQPTLTPQQRQQIIDMIKGTGTNSSLIPAPLRSEILANLSSLPPGIQQRLLRGRGLPNGIAKKFPLPASVPPAVNLPANYQVIVIGSNVVVFNTTTSLIVDVLINVL